MTPKLSRNIFWRLRLKLTLFISFLFVLSPIMMLALTRDGVSGGGGGGGINVHSLSKNLRLINIADF